MAISNDTKAAIIKDGEEGRLTQQEIAAKHLGNKDLDGSVSRILKAAGVKTRKPGRPKGKIYNPNSSSQKSQSPKPIKLEEFNGDARLALIDEALSHLKASLPQVRHPKGFSDWTSALDRLLNQRREEEPNDPGDTEDDGYLSAVRETAKDDWKEEASALQVASTEQKAAPGNELVDA